MQHHSSGSDMHIAHWVEYMLGGIICPHAIVKCGPHIEEIEGITECLCPCGRFGHVGVCVWMLAFVVVMGWLSQRTFNSHL